MTLLQLEPEPGTEQTENGPAIPVLTNLTKPCGLLNN